MLVLQVLNIKLLPKFFNFKNIIKRKNKTIEIYDKLHKITNKEIIYKNNTKINYENYLKEQENIEQFLNMKIHKINRLPFNKVSLMYKEPFNLYTFDYKQLKKDYVFFGNGFKHKEIYIKLNELTHYFIVGQSGSGKSVFQNLLINNFIYNLDNLEKLILVDLKGGVEFLQYKQVNKNKIIVIDSITKLNKLLNFLVNKMEKRYNEMIKKDIKNWDGKQIIVLIDEFVSIKDQSNLLDKNENKELNNNLRTLLGKSRASGIKFFISTQKGTSDSIDTTIRENLQTKILLRTISKDGQRAVLGGNEVIEELGVEPSKFTKGKMIFFSETLTDYIQSPYIQEDFYKNFIKEKGVKK